MEPRSEEKGGRFAFDEGLIVLTTYQPAVRDGAWEYFVPPEEPPIAGGFFRGSGVP